MEIGLNYLLLLKTEKPVKHDLYREELARGFDAGFSSKPWSRNDREVEKVTGFDGQKALDNLVNRSHWFLAVLAPESGVLDSSSCRCGNHLPSLLSASIRQAHIPNVDCPEPKRADVIARHVEFTFPHYAGLLNDQPHRHSADSHSSSPSNDLSAPLFMADQLEV